jgi:hypothetical protein
MILCVSSDISRTTLISEKSTTQALCEKYVLWFHFYLTLNTQPATSTQHNSHSRNHRFETKLSGSCVTLCRGRGVSQCRKEVNPQYASGNVLLDLGEWKVAHGSLSRLSSLYKNFSAFLTCTNRSFGRTAQKTRS